MTNQPSQPAPPPPGAFTARLLLRNARKPLDWQLLDAIAAIIGAGPCIDVGAGVGRWVRQLRRRGVVCEGVDGCPDAPTLSRGRVWVADLARPVAWPTRYRWALCIEVGEHIPPAREGVFLDNIVSAASEGAIVSWSRDGQRGAGHVNCHEPEEVAALFAARRFAVDELATKLLRVASLRESKSFCHKLLVLRREGKRGRRKRERQAMVEPSPARAERRAAESATPTDLDIILDGRPARVTATEARADQIIVRVRESSVTEWRIIGVGQAVDRAAFWAAWRAVGGERQGLTWEDGTPFPPGE